MIHVRSNWDIYRGRTVNNKCFLISLFQTYISSYQRIHSKSILMMGGFGALKAMNDSIRQNRELLKANKKKPFEKTPRSGKSSENLLDGDRKLSDADRIKIVQGTWQFNRDERRKQIIGLVISFILVGIMIAGFLAWW